MSNEVIIYSRSTCPFCVKAKALLEQEGVAYQEIDINLFPEKRSEMIEKSNGRTTVPQIFINGKHIGGCDDLFAYHKQHGTLIVKS
jgi:glutaredoxin 3